MPQYVQKNLNYVKGNGNADSPVKNVLTFYIFDISISY